MTPDEFRGWRQMMGFSQDSAATALDLSSATIQNYERGTRIDGRPATIPFTTALACSALYHRLEPWGGAGTAAKPAITGYQIRMAMNLPKHLPPLGMYYQIYRIFDDGSAELANDQFYVSEAEARRDIPAKFRTATSVRSVF